MRGPGLATHPGALRCVAMPATTEIGRLVEFVDSIALLGHADGVRWPGRCRVEKDPPPCGNCKGSGKITYQRPKKQPDGTVIWVDSIENCDVCGGTGKCS